MSTTMADAALFSKDGQRWQDGTPLVWTAREAVTKIVVGTLETDRAKTHLAQPLPANLAARYPRLTHLHLWGIGEIDTLSTLPAGLTCLDVRRCVSLTSLPELPDTLELLDLGWCHALQTLAVVPKALARFYFNDCTSLSVGRLGSALAALKDKTRTNPVVEIDGSRCPAVVSLDDVPRTLRKLVLAGCERLDSVAGLGELGGLEHLDLSGCTSLRSLPELPPALQYLALRGAEQLTDFIGNSIGPLERGSADRVNVIATFRSYQKHRLHPTATARAKLLLLGNGRGGKSTLVKRLQWDCLNAEEQASPAFQHLRPDPKQPFTHMVEFNEWATTLRLPPDAVTQVNAMARAAGIVVPPCSRRNEIDGSIHIWDFGGQELYHQTHRIFASEGSVFLIVWSARPWSDEEILRDKPLGVEDADWLALNHRRSLDYWLDYLDDLHDVPKTDAGRTRHLKVILVCTHCPPGAERPRWEELAPRHQHLPLECYYVDSLDPDCPRHPDYTRLVASIRAHCGAEAIRIGIVKPEPFAAGAGFVAALLDGRSGAPATRMMPRSAWSAALKSHDSATRSPGPGLDDNDVTAITSYLHDAGLLFHLRGRSDDAVIVDQRWASTLIYDMLLPGGDLGRRVVAHGGRFYHSDLVENVHWKSLADDAERAQFLHYMEQCGIVVKLIDRSEHRQGQDLYLATERWLLPRLPDVEVRIADSEQALEAAGGRLRQEKFWFEDVEVSESDFRALMAHAARAFGSDGLWFRDGFHVASHEEHERWCFQVRWQARGRDGFMGTADARLVAPPAHVERAVARIERRLGEEGSPFPRPGERSKAHGARPDESELAQFFRPRLRGSQSWDVAISSSGADEHVVTPLRDALRRAFPPPRHEVKWYKDDPPAGRSPLELRDFIDRLGKSRCYVLFVSESYLSDAASNPYRIRELADAVVEVADEQRPLDSVVLVYADGVTPGIAKDRAIRALQVMEDAFLEEYLLTGANKDQFADLNAWHLRFQAGRMAAGRFFDAAVYVRIRSAAGGSPDYSVILDRLRHALL